jgi:transposase
VLRQKWSRSQIEARLSNMPSCVIGMEACVGAHYLSRKLQSQGHDARLMPAKYVRPHACRNSTLIFMSTSLVPSRAMLGTSR